MSKRSCCTSFQLSWYKEYNGAIDDTLGITCCKCLCQCITLPIKLCCTSFWLSWCKEYNGDIGDAISITWYLCHWCYMTKPELLHLIFIILTLGMKWYCWQHCWHHVILTPVSVVSSTKNAMLHLISITLNWVMQWWHWHQVTLTLASMALHGQKCHVSLHFDHLDIRNVMVPLTISSASCDASAKVNGFMWQKAMLHFIFIILT